MRFSEIQKKFDVLFKEVNKVVVGQNEVVQQVVAALLCDGHALLEGNPGLAKTLTIRTLSDALSLKFSRIQGTPDLLPSDVTGTYIIDDSKKRDFKFQPGPVFANIVLLDELNRAAPKTHSALLEAMQERQVTVGNSTFKLDNPFIALATQNPIEQEGSLSLDQHVFVDGELKTGYELLEFVREKQIPCIKNGNFSLYELPSSSTFSLNPDGKLVKSRGFLYTLPCKDEVILVKTKTGREVTVTKNHPFLVNEKGKIFWKKAEDLSDSDYLVSVSSLPEMDSQVEVFSHEEVMARLKNKYQVVSYEDFLSLRDRSSHFTDFSSYDGRDFDKLRVVSGLSIKELSLALGFRDKKHYWQLVRFLRRPTQNTFIYSSVSSYFSNFSFSVDEPVDFIDSLRPIQIKRFSVDEDIAFFLGFLLSDGGKSGAIYSCQKNYPLAFDRFVDILREKIGVGISFLYEDSNGCRFVSKSSRPFVEYICLRFGLSEKNHKISALPSWLVKFPSSFRKEFLKTFISLEGIPRDGRIHTSQVNKQSINVLSYMLLKEGIISHFSSRKNKGRKHRDHILRIYGEDYRNYLETIGWIDTHREKELLSEVLSRDFSSSRVLPCPRDKVLRLVKLLGLNSFHTYKKRSNFLSNDWYCAYKSIKEGRTAISVGLFNCMLDGLEIELSSRKALSLSFENPSEVRHAAVLCGLPITEVASSLGCHTSTIWSYYGGNNVQCSSSIVSFVEQSFSERLVEADQLLSYLKGLVPEGIFYDRIKSLSYRPYQGKVFGLTVPGLQNYVAGHGACGLNHNTFKLSEAQADRFLFKILVDYPKYDEELEILDRFTEAKALPKVKPVFTKDTIMGLQALTKQVPIARDFKKYAVDLVSKTRTNKKLVEYGASPRASISLVLAAKARALLNNRKHVSKEDLKAMAYPVLRHRIILNFEAERNNMDEDAVISHLMSGK